MNPLDLFFPRQVKCIFCGRETKIFGICDECYNLLPIITGSTCIKCGVRMVGKGKACVECKNRQTALDRNYAVLEYKDDIQSKIIAFKQGGVKHIGETFAFLIYNKFKEIDENIDLIIPVPISEERKKIRKYNQSEVLACELLESGKVVTDILLRPQDTPHQTGLGRKNRETNLKGAFKVKDKLKIKNKNILLLDDIYTTGSTLNECAKTLKDAGANSVIGLVLARAVPRVDKILEGDNNTSEKSFSLAFDKYDII